MKNEKQVVNGVRYGPVVPERPDQYGSVPGLDDEELAGPDELERWVVFQEWGPILSLPVKKHHRWMHPNYGAFDTVDFERLYGQFDRARYKADRLREELEAQVIMLSMLMERVPGRAKFLVLKYLNMGVIDLDQIENPDMHAIARRHLRCKRLRSEIKCLRKRSRERWLAESDG